MTRHTDRYRILRALSVVLTLLLTLTAGSAWGADASRPNIVVILADDLGRCDSELYGCATAPTPNINRIAAEGVLFDAG